MTDPSDSKAPGEPPTPAARPFEGRISSSSSFRANLRRRLFSDRIAKRFVSFGGAAIVFSVLAIFGVIAAEVFPLFQKPKASAEGTVQAPVRPLAVGCDEYREIGYLVGEDGKIQFASLLGKKPLESVLIPSLEKARLSCLSSGAIGEYVAGTSDGRLIPFRIEFPVSYSEGEGIRTVSHRVEFEEAFLADPENPGPVLSVVFAKPEKLKVFAAQTGANRVALYRVEEKRGLAGGPGKKNETRQSLEIPGGNKITEMLLDQRAEDLFLGTSTGQILHYDIGDFENPSYGGAVRAAARENAPITALSFLLGDRSLIVGDGSGGVGTWQIEQIPGLQERRIQKIYDFRPHGSAVKDVAFSWRDKGFLTADASGQTQVHYGTTGETLLSLQHEAGEVEAIAFTPKADGLLAASSRGEIGLWKLLNPHPDISPSALFGKIWYEGYEKPEYVWQSTGGSDDFEAKFSLVPLIYGTLKGTFYALLFAIPLALLGALYTSQFMHPSLRGIVKPSVEIMAALPSVVLGFVAGLWIAPNIEKVVPGLFLMPILIPATIFLALMFWRTFPSAWRSRVRAGGEILLLIPVVLLGGWLSVRLGFAVEERALFGDYRQWLQEILGLTYDQRNSLVVGFAMGFAVIPIIFTIAEDSLSNVPPHLVAGSLALGATRWQTALRVVLPTASPGIFSAIMIGFGRAVGETMIVLMATGNTPVMDMSVFSGFRALSANIAVELPEAPEGGSLYRVLFMAALLLFLMTFLVNTAAEVVRIRLRNKHRVL